ncbi:MAG: hypothetical protein KKF98_10940, partial [Bacteroidetes bacterium]|nr:hypothetical protein [Bacteroidota bacterium]
LLPPPHKKKKPTKHLPIKKTPLHSLPITTINHKHKKYQQTTTKNLIINDMQPPTTNHQPPTTNH